MGIVQLGKEHRWYRHKVRRDAEHLNFKWPAGIPLYACTHACYARWGRFGSDSCNSLFPHTTWSNSPFYRAIESQNGCIFFPISDIWRCFVRIYAPDEKRSDIWLFFHKVWFNYRVIEGIEKTEFEHVWSRIGKVSRCILEYYGSKLNFTTFTSVYAYIILQNSESVASTIKSLTS